MKKLFKCTTSKSWEFYVIAENWQKAVDYLGKVLDENDYGYSDYRKVVKVALIAVENLEGDKQYFFNNDPGHLLISKE